MADNFETEIIIKADKAIASLGTVNLSIDKLNANLDAEKKQLDEYNKTLEGTAKKLGQVAAAQNKLASTTRQIAAYVQGLSTEVRSLNQILSDPVLKNFSNNFKINDKGFDSKAAVSSLQRIFGQTKIITNEMQKQIELRQLMNAPLLSGELSRDYQRQLSLLQQIEQNIESIQGTNVEVIRTKELELGVIRKQIAALKDKAATEKASEEANRTRNRLNDTNVTSRGVIREARKNGPFTVDSLQDSGTVTLLRAQIEAAQRLNPLLEHQAQLRAQLNKGVGNDHLSSEQQVQIQRYNIMIESLQRLAGANKAVAGAVQGSISHLEQQRSALEKGHKAVQNVTVSWESFQRLVLARVITSVFYNLQNAIFSTVGTADDLLIRLGEIQTIITESAQNPQGLEQSLTSIYDISNKLNFSSIDVAAGYYEALSNQVGETDFQIKQFLESAGGLAKVTRSTLAQSSDALASAVNAYGVSTSELDETTKVFFDLVDDGRFRLEEIANTFGSVAVIASQLGITLPDVGAALATISIKGVNAATSQTLLRNVMLSLVKPSKAMNALFDEWGVASGEAALATFGFGGVLDKFNTLADQGAEAVGDVFRNVRSIRGAMGLSGDALEKFNKSYAKMIGSQEQYDKALQLVFTNSGEVVSRRLNQIQNDAQQTAVKFVQLAGIIGANDYVASFLSGSAKIVAGVAAIAAAFAAGQFAAKQLGATIHAAGYSAESAAFRFANAKVFGGVAAGLAAAAIAYTLFAKTTDQRLAEIEQRNQEAARNFRKDFTEKLINESKAAAAEFNNNLTIALQGVAAKISNISAEVKKLELEKLKDTFLPDLERMKDALGSDDLTLSQLDGSAANLDKMGIAVRYTTKSLKEQQDVLKGIGKELDSQLKTSTELLNKNQRDSFKGGIDRQLQFVQGPAKAQAQAQVAGQFLNGAQNAQNIDAARSAIEDARKYLQEAEQTAFATGALGSPEQHMQFFNARFAAIDEAERGIELRFQNNLKQQRAQKSQEFDDIDVELAKREDLIKSFEREATLYKFFQDKISVIRKQKLDEKTTSNQINDVVNQASQVLSPGGTESLRKDSALAGKIADKEAALEEQTALIKSGNDLVTMYQDQQTALETLKTTMQNTKGQVDGLREVFLGFLDTAKTFSASTDGAPIDRGNIPKVRRALQNAPLDAIDPTEFAIQVQNIFKIIAEAQKETANTALVNNDAVTDKSQTVAGVVESQLPVIKQIDESLISYSKTITETQKAEEEKLRIINEQNVKENELQKAREAIVPATASADAQAQAASSEEELPLATAQDALLILASDLGGISEDMLSRYNEAIQVLQKSKDELMLPPKDNFVSAPAPDNFVSQKGQGPGQSPEGQTFIGFLDQVIPFLEAENQARLANGPQINGQPLIRGPEGPLINGQPLDRGQSGPLINGQPADQVLGETINSASRASIPQAMAEGSQSIPQAMAAGAPAISNAVVAGMTEAFRRNQIAPPAQVAGPPDNYYATGGPVGTDTVRAWLTPGEYVVNAQATRKHFRELQAINVGRAPQYYAKGGSVSQTFQNTFNVQSDNPQQSVGKIARAIKRQVRQGKISLQQGLVY